MKYNHKTASCVNTVRNFEFLYFPLVNFERAGLCLLVTHVPYSLCIALEQQILRIPDFAKLGKKVRVKLKLRTNQTQSLKMA